MIILREEIENGLVDPAHCRIRWIRSEGKPRAGGGMAPTVCPGVSAAARPPAPGGDPGRPRPAAGGRGSTRRGGPRRPARPRPAVWRRQRRPAGAGVDRLLRDKAGKPGGPPTPEAVVRRSVAPTCAGPPGEAAHGTGRTMAKAAGPSLRTVPRIRAAHEPQPRRLRTFERRRDPDFVAKLADIVGLPHPAPPAAPCRGAGRRPPGSGRSGRPSSAAAGPATAIRNPPAS
jgi:hypothetical protein